MGAKPVPVIMLTSEHCQKCAMMERILGDRVEAQRAEDRPNLVASTAYTELPLFFVIRDGITAGCFSGLMPLSAFEARVKAYGGEVRPGN
jgi:hypothetical protein